MLGTKMLHKMRLLYSGIVMCFRSSR